jgi:hypothetical protein
LTCKAFEKLENFTAQTEKSSAPEISFCNLILKDKIESRVAPVKNQFKTTYPGMAETRPDEPDEMDKDILMLTSPEEAS